MRDRVFIDTNVLIYSIGDNAEKKIKARKAILSNGEPVISSQVISEFINACLIKNLLKLDKVISLANKFMDALEFSLGILPNKGIHYKEVSSNKESP
jgi:predicted nucleic acid-binding protein